MKLIHKQFKNLKLISLLSLLIYFKYSFSQLSPWREDEAVTLWLSLVNNIFDSPFGNVSSKGIPNPNLSVVLSKFLILFDSFSMVSFVLALIQMSVIYYAFRNKNNVFNNVLLLFVGFNLYLTYLTSTIWYQFMITTVNALFLKIIFDFVFEKKYYLFPYFPLIALLPASLYLGGVSNSILFSLFFFIAIIINLKNFKSFFSNISHLFFSTTLFLSLLFFTWFQYFKNIDINLLRIQSGSQFFPYSRIKDYLYVGYQSMKDAPQFFLDVFSSADKIYFLFSYSDKLTQKSENLINLTFFTHKLLNITSLGVLFIAVIFIFINKKDKLNLKLLYKNVFILFYILSFTIATPLIGGREFLQFDIMALSVFASLYVCFLFIWISLPFIFKEFTFFNKFLNIFLYIFLILNIASSITLRDDFLNSNSFSLSEADESVIFKEDIVDFLALKSGKNIKIYYDLGGEVYNWIPEFNEKNYSTNYYKNSFSIGRDFDYLLKRKYNIDNTQEGKIIRSYKDTDFYIGYNFEDFPEDVYTNYQHHVFGNYRVTENLARND